jgi:hypothetical protein
MAKVLADNKELVARFYTLSKGSVENIGILLRYVVYRVAEAVHLLFWQLEWSSAQDAPCTV